MEGVGGIQPTEEEERFFVFLTDEKCGCEEHKIPSLRVRTHAWKNVDQRFGKSTNPQLGELRSLALRASQKQERRGVICTVI